MRVFLQARMSSRRFPGKVLAPFKGRPLILHVIDAITCAFHDEIPVTALTSDDPSDDPLVVFLGDRGIDVVRGPLDDVFRRFAAALSVRPCDAFLRLNGDSPLLPPPLLVEAIEAFRTSGADLVTTAFPRTFPRGQNVEVVARRAWERVDPSELGAADREHVTSVFYRHAERFRIVNIESSDRDTSHLSFAVDTVADLERLEALSVEELRAIGCRVAGATA